MIVGGISHQMQRLFSFLNFSDGFEKKPRRAMIVLSLAPR